MIPQENVGAWLTNASVTNSIVEFELDEAMNLSNRFKRGLVELKVQVDRWDLVTETFILNTSLKPLVKKLLGAQCNIENDEIKIWGSTFHFSDVVPVNNILGVCESKQYDDYRHVALGILPTDKIQRMLDLKAFW